MTSNDRFPMQADITRVKMEATHAVTNAIQAEMKDIIEARARAYILSILLHKWPAMGARDIVVRLGVAPGSETNAMMGALRAARRNQGESGAGKWFRLELLNEINAAMSWPAMTREQSQIPGAKKRTKRSVQGTRSHRKIDRASAKPVTGVTVGLPGTSLPGTDEKIDPAPTISQELSEDELDAAIRDCEASKEEFNAGARAFDHETAAFPMIGGIGFGEDHIPDPSDESIKIDAEPLNARPVDEDGPSEMDRIQGLLPTPSVDTATKQAIELITALSGQRASLAPAVRPALVPAVHPPKKASRKAPAPGPYVRPKTILTAADVRHMPPEWLAELGPAAQELRRQVEHEDMQKRLAAQAARDARAAKPKRGVPIDDAISGNAPSADYRRRRAEAEAKK